MGLYVHLPLTWHEKQRVSDKIDLEKETKSSIAIYGK
jgi:hypothetical protein